MVINKHKDEYAKTADITKKDKSVVSGKTIQQVEKTSSKYIWTGDDSTRRYKKRYKNI